jgi:hypothetical protein
MSTAKSNLASNPTTKTSKVYEYTFTGTGVTVLYQKVNINRLLLDVRRALEPKRPLPDVIVVEKAGQMVREAQDQDPDYQDKLEAWNQDVNRIAEQLTIKSAIIEISDPDWKEAAAQLRSTMESFGIDSGEKDDKIFYISHIAAGSETELMQFYQDMSRHNQVTEDEVQRNIQTFRPSE